MARFNRLSRRREEEDTELNMVPIMNMFIVLIPFLLMSASFFHIKAINTSIPVNSETAKAEAKERTDPKLTVVLELKIDKIRISAISSDLSEETLAKIGTTFSGTNDLKKDTQRLGEYLKGLKGRYPASDTVLMVPDDSISYNEVIQVMDCARASGTTTLFPNVVLTASLG